MGVPVGGLEGIPIDISTYGHSMLSRYDRSYASCGYHYRLATGAASESLRRYQALLGLNVQLRTGLRKSLSELSLCLNFHIIIQR